MSHPAQSADRFSLFSIYWLRSSWMLFATLWGKVFTWLSVDFCFMLLLQILKKKEQYPSFFFYLFVWFTVIPEINCVSACFCWKEQTVSKTFCCIFRLDELSTDNWRCLMFCWICRTGGQTFLAECSESYMFMNSIDLDTKIKK